MRETPKARQAFNDYLAAGADRSLEKLASKYQSRTENVATRQLSRLKQWSVAHQWQARLAKIAEAERAAIVALGIANKQNRVDALNDRWQGMQRVIDERATDAAMVGIAGGQTGLLVHREKVIGAGKMAYRTDEYEVDTGLLKELREHEKQAAQELGQWVEKTEEAGQQKIVIEYVNDWRTAPRAVADAPSGADDSAPAGEAV